MSVTSRFIKVFDPANETHVKWFTHMMELAESLSPEKAVTLVAEINMNPMKVELDHRTRSTGPIFISVFAPSTQKLLFVERHSCLLT